MKKKLILLRHGQSEWNKANVFTGWVDIPLSMGGIEEALEAGKKISEIPIDLIFISSLCRASMTAFIAMSQHKGGRVPVVLHPEDSKLAKWGEIHDPKSAAATIPVIEAWELNERWYGDLQGLNKRETMDKYGEEQVQIWRRSFDTAPPNGESLAGTAARALPYFKEKIVAELQSGKNVFVSAHGNSLRAILMHLDCLSKDEVMKLEIPTGKPIIYDFDEGAFTKVS